MHPFTRNIYIAKLHTIISYFAYFHHVHVQNWKNININRTKYVLEKPFYMNEGLYKGCYQTAQNYLAKDISYCTQFFINVFYSKSLLLNSSSFLDEHWLDPFLTFILQDERCCYALEIDAKLNKSNIIAQAPSFKFLDPPSTCTLKKYSCNE